VGRCAIIFFDCARASGICCMSQKNSRQVFCWLRAQKKISVSFFLALLTLLAQKLSAKSRPSAESWLVAELRDL